jgi:hypothetical protein
MKRLLLSLTGLCILSFATACDDGDDEGSGGSAGTAASGGSAGSGGSGGSGTGGTAGGGTGGTGGSAGGGATGGAGGSGGSAGGGSGEMSFFVSSTPPSGTGNLGGLAGADDHCRMLATAAGSTKTQWFAYLSAEDDGTGSPVSARDRIGSGPWFNADGQMLAANLTALHPTIDPATDRDGYIAVKPADALFTDENGDSVPGQVHDILTGSNADGTVAAGNTCEDWTSASTEVTAQVGHSDTPSSTMFSPSWNSAHASMSCSEEGLIAFGGNGRIYCFATD